MMDDNDGQQWSETRQSNNAREGEENVGWGQQRWWQWVTVDNKDYERWMITPPWLNSYVE